MAGKQGNLFEIFIFFFLLLFDDANGTETAYSALEAVIKKSIPEAEMVSWKIRSLNLLLFILG